MDNGILGESESEIDQCKSKEKAVMEDILSSFSAQNWNGRPSLFCDRGQ